MEREDAIAKLKTLEGQNLQEMASFYGVTLRNALGKVNKGWAGHVCERHLGLPINSKQEPDFGSWELKVVPIKQLKLGDWVYKETMAITMIDPIHVVSHEFHESHLYAKLKKFVLVVRTVGGHVDEPSFVNRVTAIDLDGPISSQVEADYNEVRNCLLDSKRGFAALTGSMGVYVQPRTKGPGHGSISRAFYARTGFLELIAPVRRQLTS